MYIQYKPTLTFGQRIWGKLWCYCGISWGHILGCTISLFEDNKFNNYFVRTIGDNGLNLHLWKLVIFKFNWNFLNKNLDTLHDFYKTKKKKKFGKTQVHFYNSMKKLESAILTKMWKPLNIYWNFLLSLGGCWRFKSFYNRIWVTNVFHLRKKKGGVGKVG